MARKLIKEVEREKRHNHIYDLDDEIAPSFIRDCLSLENITSVESLDCSKSFMRQKRDDISVNDVLTIINGSGNKFFSFIYRKGYSIHKFGEHYWEFCASGMKDSVEHFLWIEIEEESGFKLVEKYKLIKNDNS